MTTVVYDEMILALSVTGFKSLANPVLDNIAEIAVVHVVMLITLVDDALTENKVTVRVPCNPVALRTNGGVRPVTSIE